MKDNFTQFFPDLQNKDNYIIYNLDREVNKQIHQFYISTNDIEKLLYALIKIKREKQYLKTWFQDTTNQYNSKEILIDSIILENCKSATIYGIIIEKMKVRIYFELLKHRNEKIQEQIKILIETFPHPNKIDLELQVNDIALLDKFIGQVSDAKIQKKDLLIIF